MLDLTMSVLSSTAGNLADGVAKGGINRSEMVSIWSNISTAQNVFALRKDTSGAFNVYTDLSAEAVANTDDLFMPFGSDSEMSQGDEIWLADSDKPINEIYVKITTPGSYTGTIQVYESVDGVSLIPVTNLVDSSNGFKNANGVYKISFDSNKENRKAIIPEFGKTARKYIVIKLATLTAATTSPKLSRIWLVGTETDNNSWTDYTAIINGSMTSSDFTAGSYSSLEFFPIIGNESRFAFRGPTIGTYDAVYRGIPNSYGVIVEYLAADNTWKALPNYSDESANFTAPGTALRTTPLYYYRKWSIPSDWTQMSLTHGTSTITAYWIRRRIVSVSIYGPVPIQLYRRRSLSFGEGLAYGVYHNSVKNYKCINYYIGIPSTTDTVVALTNTVTGSSRTFTIPADSFDSGLLPNGRIEFVSALNVSAGQALMISHVSGGTLADIEFHIESL